MNLIQDPDEPVGYDGFGAPIYEPADHVSLWRSDSDLPGMWSKSDFEGGDPDERSYAEREGQRQTIGWVDEAHHWPIRFITGIDPADDIDFDAFRSDAIWTISKSMTFEYVDPELMELIYGQPVVPLCMRQIPTRGTE